MEAIGIIFFACLAFALAILILITCCFFKVNAGKNPNDLERSSDSDDTINRIRQMAYKKPDDGKIASHNQNVILFIHKKHPNDTTLLKHNEERSNRKQRSDDADVIDEGYQNGEGHHNDGESHHKNENNCSSSHVQATSCHPNHESNHFVTTHHDIGSSSHQGMGHFNDGFHSHIDSSHHNSGWGHHSGDSGHHGHHLGIGHDNHGGDGDD